MPTAENVQEINSFKCIFEGFWKHFQKGCDSEDIFCQTAVYVVHLPVVVSVFCIVCTLNFDRY